MKKFLVTATIFGEIWLSGLRGGDLNVKVYDVQWTPSDGKSWHGLWPGETKTESKLDKIL